MSVVRELIKAAMLGALAVTMACSGSNDDDPSNPSTGDVAITSVSEYTIWGQVMTIQGSGFSSVATENIVRLHYYPGWCAKKYTTEAGGDMEMITASATEIKVRIPYDEGKFADCGPEYATVEGEVKGKVAKLDNVKFVGLPKVGVFDYHYGWYDMPNLTRIGDSVLISPGLQGSNWKQSPWADKLRLTVAGKNVPIKYRHITNSKRGWAAYLPTKEFGEVECGDGQNGWNDRALTFTFHVEGTESSHSRDMFVQYLPWYSEVTSIEGPKKVSRLGTLNPEWEIEGVDMYFNQAIFVPVEGCSSNATHSTAVAPSEGFKNHITLGIPLSLLSDCMYSVYLKNPCDEREIIGSVEVVP